MKIALLPILAGAVLAAAAASHGQPLLNYIGDNRSISVSGVAGGIDGSNSYSYTNSPSAPYATFAGSVNGVADWQDTTPLTTPSYTNQEPGNYHAESGASQTSMLDGGSLFASSRVWGSCSVSLQGPYGPANPVASSIFEVTFELTVPVQYELTVGFGPNFSSWPYYDRGTPSLFPVGQSQLLSAPAFESTAQYPSLFRYQGILDPGAYTLLMTQGFSLPADPFGQMLDVSYDMNFTVTAIPEPSVAALLGMGLFALLLRNRRNRA